jgi:uncharacterized membrane protein YphA (DoxX/SURF4 family)
MIDWKNCKCGSPDLGLLFMRLALGGVFAVHGWAKLQNLEGTAGFFGSLGLPGGLAYLVAVVEFFGGIAIILGLFTHWLGKAMALIMVGAIFFVKWPKGGWNASEFELALLTLALGVTMLGPGNYTVKKLLK